MRSTSGRMAGNREGSRIGTRITRAKNIGITSIGFLGKRRNILSELRNMLSELFGFSVNNALIMLIWFVTCIALVVWFILDLKKLKRK